LTCETGDHGAISVPDTNVAGQHGLRSRIYNETDVTVDSSNYGTYIPTISKAATSAETIRNYGNNIF